MEDINLDNLPQKMTFSESLKGTFDHLKESQAEEAYSLVQDAASKGEIGKDDFPTLETFLKLVKKSIEFFVVTDDDNNNKVIMLINILPATVSRSTVTVYNAGYIILDPSCRNRGGGKRAMTLCFEAAKKMGFEGVVSRISTTNVPMLVALKKFGSVTVGTIPYSNYHEKFGWTDDLVVLTTYDFIPGTYDIDTDKSISYRTNQGNIPHLKFEVKLTAREHTFKDGTKVTLTLASEEEVKEVDSMILSAAKKGEGFSEDEFLEHGVLNRMFFRKYNTILAKLESGQILAAVTFGPSTLCRSVETIILHGYMIVHEKFRGRGYGTEMMKMMTKLAKDLNSYQGISTDVYECDLRSLKLCRNAGMTCTGTLPKSGVMKSYGMANTCIYFLKI